MAIVPWWTWLVWLLVLAFVWQGLMASQVASTRLVQGANNLGEFLAQAFPPDLSRLRSLSAAMNLFQYQQALAVILIILLVVISCEQLSIQLRRQLL